MADWEKKSVICIESDLSQDHLADAVVDRVRGYFRKLVYEIVDKSNENCQCDELYGAVTRE